MKREKIYQKLRKNFGVSKRHRNLADKLGLDIGEQRLKFYAYHHEKGNKYYDWDKAFSTWLNLEARFKPKFTPMPKFDRRNGILNFQKLLEGTQKMQETTENKLIPEHWVVTIFSRMKDIYGDAWTQKYAENGQLSAVIDSWQIALKGCNGDDIATGLRRCREERPTSVPDVLQFAALCQPALEFPDELEAFQAARNKDFAHPAVRYAYHLIGSWEFRHAKETHLRYLFKAAWDEAKKEMARARSENRAIGEPIIFDPLPMPGVNDNISVGSSVAIPVPTLRGCEGDILNETAENELSPLIQKSDLARMHLDKMKQSLSALEPQD